MTNEEKLQEAKRLYKTANADQRYVLESLFPELRESEDERIRQDIIWCLKHSGIKDSQPINPHVTTITKDAIAWLEKQKKQNPALSEEDEKIKEEIINYFECRSKDEPTRKNIHNKWIAWLKKQGEQEKPQGYVTADGDIITYSETEGYAVIEPKFHKGDWVIHQGTENIYQVVAIIDNHYQLKYGDNYTVQKCADVDRCARLWTIADAKDGDILTTDIWTFIFKKYQDKSVYYHCAVSEFNSFYISDTGEFDSNYVHPATKEQRDTLEKAMIDAGYTFDFEKKELKKIEQKPAENKGMNLVEEDMTPFQKKVFCIVDTTIEKEQGLSNICNELLALALQENQQEPAEWSVEDEKQMDNLIQHLRVAYSPCDWLDETIKWLKSLRFKYWWVPSEEMLEALYRAVPQYSEDGKLLDKLYQGLKYGIVINN